MSRTEKEFIQDLRNELVATQNQRFRLTQQKLAFVIALLGIGVSLSPTQPSVNPLLYLAPIVALIFDLYIIGDNFGIRRIGIFIREIKESPKKEKYWEYLLPNNRDIFASYASPISTFIVYIIASLSLFDCNFKPFHFYYIWNLIVLASLVFWLIYKDYILKNKLRKFEKNIKTEEKEFEKKYYKKKKNNS